MLNNCGEARTAPWARHFLVRGEQFLSQQCTLLDDATTFESFLESTEASANRCLCIAVFFWKTKSHKVSSLVTKVDGPTLRFLIKKKRISVANIRYI